MTEISFAEKSLFFNRVYSLWPNSLRVNIAPWNIEHIVLLVTVRFVLLAEKKGKEMYLDKTLESYCNICNMLKHLTFPR